MARSANLGNMTRGGILIQSAPNELQLLETFQHLCDLIGSLRIYIKKKAARAWILLQSLRAEDFTARPILPSLLYVPCKCRVVMVRVVQRTFSSGR